MAGLGTDLGGGLAEMESRTDALPAWAELLAREAARLLAAGNDASGRENLEGTEQAGVMARFTRTFEATLIRAALKHTRGRRVEAAQRLGIGRNTITRKIQELGLDE
jgi:two-component system nitrogen regulation response regulator GlnG